MPYFHKKCSHCGSTWTVTLSSISKILCADCLKYSAWNLKENKPSVLIDGLIGSSEISGNSNSEATNS